MTRPLAILVVEDDAALRDVYSQLLEAEGHDVRVAVDGEAALAMLSGDLDLIVTDLNMPRMSGAAFLHVLRGTVRYAGLPVLVISARPELLPESLQGPLTTLIRKPFRIEHFARYVETIATHAVPQ